MRSVVITVELPAAVVGDLRARLMPLNIAYEPHLVAPYDSDQMHRVDRSCSAQAAFDTLLDSADALLGVPDHSPVALAALIRRNPQLQWVHTIAAGGGSQVKAAQLTPQEWERVTFTTSAGVHAQPLAEFALLGVLAGIKQLPRFLASQRRKIWEKRRPLGLLSEATVAVVGLGNVGRRTAEILDRMGARVIGVHRRDLHLPYIAKTIHTDQLGSALAECDAVVLALPDTTATRNLLDGETLAQARDGIVVVNVGRGTTVDEPALLAALDEGHVSTAVLDVTAVEPLPEHSRLWAHPRVILSPHTAAFSANEPALVGRLFAENAERWLADLALINTVNAQEFY